MLPPELKTDSFRRYPPEARKLVSGYATELQQLPLSFVPSLLREAIEYDYKFPAERRALEKELANLHSLSSEQVREWFRGFAIIELSSQLERFDWVNSPAQFVEQLSSHLWTTHQLDQFRKAAMEYADRLRAAVPAEAPAIPRLGIAIVGQGVQSYGEPLFRKLRPHGTSFTHIKPENGTRILLDAVAARSKSHPAPYGHWYIDGGTALEHAPALATVSYQALDPVRQNLLRLIRNHTEQPGSGPEALRTLMAQTTPSDLGLGKADDVVLSRFQVKLLTEGSGTQIFSTSFAQWAAREALRRAQPLTLLVRFAPRQRQKPMNEMLTDTRDRVEVDPVGSLLDADMGAYYNFLNQQRLPGADKSSFLVWFEDHGEAVAIGPTMPRGTQSANAVDLAELLSWMT